MGFTLQQIQTYIGLPEQRGSAVGTDRSAIESGQ